MKNFDSLYQELQSRAQASVEESSTAAALASGVHGIGKKVVEEAAEVWMAAEYQSKEELAEEISQLMYWVQVIMLSRDLSPEDIYRYL
ncbi:phosphoribosyl-ATP diphosphatase [Corynebacterium lowii]|uniref:Phosphoribosyl-ATP pyrophosphatase n=1 Tax=Corynebacterium lowii TaxID=1544413 RepID=A0A0Q1DZT0_9CORY|nr:phosphoribosyl-ATP diphosphatase [Corynebacterium lowii]KQB85757.1 Phosphoribosyl-ATP pyrophosphatase [Corynebacterium lowii]MDP9851059.1 phosphoribosyl-ATP pyrophosphohydrolase [Corynebacterium lowii]